MGRVGTEVMADARRCEAPPPFFFICVWFCFLAVAARGILGLAEV